MKYLQLLNAASVGMKVCFNAVGAMDEIKLNL